MFDSRGQMNTQKVPLISSNRKFLFAQNSGKASQNGPSVLSFF